MDYTHVPVEDGEDIVIGGGCYRVGAEMRLPYDGEEVLYVIGGTGAVACCCGGGGGTAFINVPGFIRAWQSKTDDAGQPVSEVEPITDKATQEEIKKALQLEHGVPNIKFW